MNDLHTHQGTPAFTSHDLGSDAELLRRLKAGDDAAFEQLVRTAGGRMLAVARRLLSDEQDAEDAVQEAFLNAFRNLAAFDGRSQLTTWLHRITVNACLMKLRSKRRRPETHIEDLLPRFMADGHREHAAVSWNPDVGAGIQRGELQAQVRSMIDTLPEPYREVLMLRDMEQFSTEVSADLLGLTPAAVKTRLHRARQSLRELLDPLMREEVAP